MSDSRLEKFIYAICSMDVTDLPVPLSRIEKLWNCLITGETPDFEPLSRNEKYLMAMLDRYDISNLPAPMSRGEKLLYKIAVGETDLSDVPGYLSRYEELLKYLIENGGISGGDFEYVLYTLNQSLYTLYATAEKPVKSAILKGQTLVNLVTQKSGSFNGTRFLRIPLSRTLNSNTNYFIKFNLRESSLTDGVVCRLRIGTNGNVVGGLESDGIITVTGDGYNYIEFYIKNAVDVTNGLDGIVDDIMVIEYQEGMENWDIPYFEGMQSVKMPVLTTTGKNLWNEEDWSKGLTSSTGVVQTGGAYDGFRYNNELISVNGYDKIYCRTFAELNGLSGYSYRVAEYDSNKTFLRMIMINGSKYHTISNDCEYIRVHFDLRYNNGISSQANPSDDIPTFGMISTSPFTEYEPYKSNILTVNEDVTLRGIGDVKDELDCLTGEVVRNIGEIVLDGSEWWAEYTSQELTNTRLFYCGVPTNSNINTSKFTMINNRFASLNPNSGGLWNTDVVGLGYGVVINAFRLRVLKSTANTINELKEYLHSNPVRVQYELAEKSIKTVDLTVVDQDNQPTQLGTFENLTHVSLEAEGLIPEVEMEVATNLLEDTVFTLTDAFNTLYATAEKPVKSAILKGQTLVNIFTQATKAHHLNVTNDGKKGFTMTGDGTATCHSWWNLELSITRQYILTFDINVNTLDQVFIIKTNDEKQIVSFPTGTTGKQMVIFTPTSSGIRFKVQEYVNGTIIVDNIMLIEYQEGMENWDIPYFEGMQSVKMPVLKTVGKNLFDGELEYGDINDITGETVENHVRSRSRSKDFIKTIPSASYFMYSDFPSDSTSKGIYVYQYDSNKNYIGLLSNGMNVFNQKFTVADNCYFIKIRTTVVSTLAFNIGVMSDGETYEPYKSNILTVNEDVTLRGIGDVKDTLDCLTGEVIERIGEIVLDGSEDWLISESTRPNHLRLYLFATRFKQYQNVINDKFADNGNIKGRDIEGIYMSNTIDIQVEHSRLSEVSVNGFKNWLRENNIKVQAILSQESIKTVDLTCVNQDGNETKLRTFDDTTHVLLNSEGLIPTAALTVRTKIPSASSTSLLMDDISNEQQQLETTVDEQSNNVDATMIATTEIYEETL